MSTQIMDDVEGVRTHPSVQTQVEYGHRNKNVVVTIPLQNPFCPFRNFKQGPGRVEKDDYKGCVDVKES